MEWKLLRERANELICLISPYGGGELVGSARRRLDISEKLELLCYPDFKKEKIKEALEDEIEFVGNSLEGVDKKLDFPVIIYLCEMEKLGIAQLYTIGSHQYVRTLKHCAERLGMNLNRNGLFKKNKLIESESEVRIFRHLNRLWVPPEYRVRRGVNRRLMDVQSFIGGKLTKTKNKVPKIEIIIDGGQIDIVWMGSGQFYRMFLKTPWGDQSTEDFINPSEAQSLIDNWNMSTK